MSDLVGNPEDRFSQNEAHLKFALKGTHFNLLLLQLLLCHVAALKSSPIHRP